MNIKKITLFFVVIAVLVFFVLNFLIPAPPKKLVMVTGSQSGAYYAVGMMFKKELAKYGITLDVRETSGSLENLALINEKNSSVDLALMQSGSAGADAYPGLESLASLFNEPL